MPPRQFHPRQGHVPSFGQIIIVVDAAIALTVPAGMSGVGSWAWDGDGAEVGGGAIYMLGEGDLTGCFGGGVCWCACGIMTWVVYVCWGFIFVSGYPAILE